MNSLKISITAAAILASSVVSAFAGNVTVQENKDFFKGMQQVYFNGLPAEIGSGVAKTELCAASPKVDVGGIKHDCTSFGNVKFVSCNGKSLGKVDGWNVNPHAAVCVKFLKTTKGDVAFRVNATGHIYSVTDGWTPKFVRVN